MAKTITTNPSIELSYAINKGYGSADAVNSPKLAPSALAVQAIRELVGTEPRNDGKHTPFGHLVKSQGGIVDMNILSGATTLNGLARGLSGASTRKSDPLAYGKSCKRVADHIKWMATKATSHGGLPSRLKNCHKNPKGLANKLAKHLSVLNETVQASFKAQYNAKGVPLA
jgi:hypothetical protein